MWATCWSAMRTLEQLEAIPNPRQAGKSRLQSFSHTVYNALRCLNQLLHVLAGAYFWQSHSLLGPSMRSVGSFSRRASLTKNLKKWRSAESFRYWIETANWDFDKDCKYWEIPLTVISRTGSGQNSKKFSRLDLEASNVLREAPFSAKSISKKWERQLVILRC